jgi:HAD superfamily hydrolase (TIGR01490 family)
MSRRSTAAAERRLAGAASAAAARTEEPRADDPSAAAFFDVDNTIMRGASIFHLARGLYRRKFFTWRDLARFAWEQARFLAVGESLSQLAQVRDRALTFVAGHTVAEITAIGEQVWEESMAAKVWPGTRALARRHLDDGQRVWLVTATPVEVASVIATRLGLTGALGTVAEHVDGVYTGRLIGEPLHGEAKAEAVRALAEREGLDLSRCAAYSDSAHDVPMLSLVGHPVAVNPDARLRAHARAHGWQVRDYRRGRRAARIGLPVATVTGIAGGAAAAAARHRRNGAAGRV